MSLSRSLSLIGFSSILIYAVRQLAACNLVVIPDSSELHAGQMRTPFHRCVARLTLAIRAPAGNKTYRIVRDKKARGEEKKQD
jgi:hypothetical protein